MEMQKIVQETTILFKYVTFNNSIASTVLLLM